MDYINAATSGTLSPHILPVMDLQRMLSHIADTLPPMLHLPVSPDDTLHFYGYLCMHILIENKQFLLLIDIPIQDRSWQITIHEVLTLSIPHGNYSAHYNIDTKCLGITKDATMAVELSTTQFWVCWEANGQFCSIATPFQPLANPPSCIAALYARSTVDITSKCSLQIWKILGINLPTQVAPDVRILTTPLAASANTITLIYPEKAIETITIQKPVHILRLPMACSTTSSNFYIPPRYETPTLDVNVSLDMANLQMINISAQDFCIWQHLGSNRSEAHLQHLTTIPSIPVHKIYQHLLNSTLPIMPFNMDKESTEHTDSTWTLFSHTGMYVTVIRSLIPAGLGLFCCYLFWCWPARSVCQPLQPCNMQYTIVDDDAEVASIYRHDGKDSQPTRLCENHGLAIEHLPTWLESQCKQQSKSLVVPVQGSLEKPSKSRGHWNAQNFCCKT